MQHPNASTRHPLQAAEEQQETGYDPLHNLNQNHSRGSLDGSIITSQLTFPSYTREWDDLFLNSNYLASVRQAGLNGRLRSSRFRSVCWKLYLDVLPEDKTQWTKKTKELRAQYEKIKETHITNPRKAAGQQDLVVNNPLSQDEGSLWNKFFQDKELRGMITQDVMRTFPEMNYFQEEGVRTKLTDILFCYARENEQLLYKQGMHELLAPIVFVLHCDHQAFQHASESATPSEEMMCLLNPAYHEHDAYAMFSQLMETAEPWFSHFEREVRRGKEEMLTSVPFARPQDAGPSVAIVTKVNRIQDQLLKKHDMELYMHLNRLEIAPQIYGIRWVRLLFGREFPLQDLLVVWDALFADSTTLDLLDHVFVAMLLYIRDALIASNFQTCLGLLMHYPPVEDAHALLHKALFLRDPKNNPRPVNYQFQQSLDYYKTRGADLVNKTRAGARPPPLNINKVSSSLMSFGRKLIAPALPGGSGGLSPVNSEGHAPFGTDQAHSRHGHTHQVHTHTGHGHTHPGHGHTHTGHDHSHSGHGHAHTGPGHTPLSTVPQRQAAEAKAVSHAPSSIDHAHYRLLKSESMPVHLSKGCPPQTLPAQTDTDTPGHGCMTVSSSPSVESLSGGRCQATASPPPSSRGSDITSSPPLSASKKESFFSMGRSRSHSKTLGRREEEDLENQVSFLQGQINDLEAMSQYCARVMHTHICKIQDVILQQHLEKEDEVLVSLAGLKQIKDILKGALRFNQSQLEAEENEEISIADDHYTLQAGRRHDNADQEGAAAGNRRQERQEPEQEEEEPEEATPPAQVACSLGAAVRPWDDYIVVAPAEATPPVPDQPGGGVASAGSSSPDDRGSTPDDQGSTHSKDSDFTIVNPGDL